MNKKGSYELADLAGFILIFLAVIIFGFMFVKLSPGSHVNIIYAEYGSHLARKGLIDFLGCSEKEGVNTADIIIWSVKNNNFETLKKATKNLFSGVAFSLTIYKDNNLLFFDTNVEDVGNKDLKVIMKKIDGEYKSESYIMPLKNFYDGNIMIKLNLLNK